MKQFSQNDPEYKGNGHYIIDGIEYMSIWTYKKKKGHSNNSNSVNGEEGIQLTANGVETKRTKPDFGGFDNIYVYPVEELNKFYNH